ncbi:hypothetical protein QAD02_023955 [Eretmocerus hayati]|uniref:Uncharacterized protein n=1 Tax=Eretmocerus hayati TaxID=131215 RepID=A0ACC2PXM4_9HYME|nr:hypothetical protein QAD02_023955 [Eretmocerus hayati]
MRDSIELTSEIDLKNDELRLGAIQEKISDWTNNLGDGQRADLGFEDLSYTVRPIFSKKKKQLLKNVSGEFRAGELTAIMGPSGAGKTVLMNVLAGFITSNVSGVITVNGRSRDLKRFRRTTAYIMQDDHAHTTLTVQECMQLAADLKLCTPRFDKKYRIEAILRRLGLEESRSTFTENLSSGQKKRLIIALELISNAPIMFFDELTSPLDSVNSKQCMELLKGLALEGRTIICTIHQPSPMILQLVDHLYVVGSGQCVYAGRPQNLLPFLRQLNLHCPKYHNPSDFLLEVVCGEYGDHLPKIVDFMKVPRRVKKFRNPIDGDMPTNDCIEPIITEIQVPEITTTEIIPSSLRIRCDNQRPTRKAYEYPQDVDYATSSWYQVRVLMRRNLTRIFRDRGFGMFIIMAHWMVAVVVGVLYGDSGTDAARSLDNIKLLIFNMLFIVFCAISSTVLTFSLEVPILTREYFNRWYRLRSIFIASTLSGIIVEVASIVSYVLIVYFMTGQIMDNNRLALYILNCILIGIMTQVIGTMFGISLKIQNAVFFSPYSMMPFVMFGGFLVFPRDMPPVLRFFLKFSAFKHCLNAFMIAIYGYGRKRLDCSKEYCHFSSPRVMLDMYDLQYEDYWSSTAVIFGYFILFTFSSYLVLRWKLRK